MTAGDSIEVVSPQKFDFGAPNPNADNSKIEQSVDYLKTASTEEIQHTMLNATLFNMDDAYPVMALSEDDTEYAITG